MTIKQKYGLLILGFLLLVWIAYKFSFLKTIELSQQYKTLKQQEEQFNAVAQNISTLKQQDAYYNTLLKKHQISTESSFQNNLLAVLNEYAESNNLKIIHFKDPHRFKMEKALQETFKFTVEGNYTTIIKLIYTLEQQYKFGKIVSVNFEKKKNYKTSKVFLQSTIYLQKISQE